LAVIGEDVLRLPKPNYTYITNEEEAGRALDEISKYNIYGLDTECTDLDPFNAKLSLIQIGIPNKAFVFDVRYDTDNSSLHPTKLYPILQDKSIKKIIQNATFDMKLLKNKFGFYLENIYDTMLVEQLFNLGLSFGGASLSALVAKYFNIHMDKEPQSTFIDYKQKFKPYQLEYAANDVIMLKEIMDSQMLSVKQHGFEEVAQLEFDFVKPLCEMELNGITMDVHKWRTIMSEIEEEKNKAGKIVSSILNANEDQTTLFGVSLVNIDSNVQLKSALTKYGLSLESTDVSELKKHAGLPIVDALLEYRRTQKLVSTYGESLLEKIHPVTGRLHTDFKQMVSTGRMSSSNPNLQNIPKKQKYRNCFIAKPGYSLLTSDMSGAELRILGNMSQDQIFIDSYAKGLDLHTRAASEVYGIPYDRVTKQMRNDSKAIQFGLIYGLSKFGLSRRLKISEKKAEEMISKYFSRYVKVKEYLDKSAADSVKYGFSRSIAGRKRFYNVPAWENPDRNRIVAGIKRQGMNMPIQSSNADTIKKAMILLVDRLEQGRYDAKLCLTVHDEVVVEAVDEQKYEVSRVVSQSLVDGFGAYFDIIPMEADTLIGPCWLKDPCGNEIDGKKCGNEEMIAVPDERYGTKIVCKQCGGTI
jgi:DNA polymerase I-like protein with 3'-5' exonuclease and polymerase domains